VSETSSSEIVAPVPAEPQAPAVSVIAHSTATAAEPAGPASEPTPSENVEPGAVAVITVVAESAVNQPVSAAAESAAQSIPLEPAAVTPAGTRPAPSGAGQPGGKGLKPADLPYGLNEASLAPVRTAPQRRRGLESALWLIAALLVIGVALAVISALFPNAISNLFGAPAPAPTTQPPTRAATPAAVASSPTTAPPIIPTPPANGMQLSLLPESDLCGWYARHETDPHYGDADLHAGSYQGKSFASIMQYDLRNLPTDSRILFGALELTGPDSSRLGTDGQWTLELVENNLAKNWSSNSPNDLAQAKTLSTLGALQFTQHQQQLVRRE